MCPIALSDVLNADGMAADLDILDIYDAFNQQSKKFNVTGYHTTGSLPNVKLCKASPPKQQNNIEVTF